MQFMEEYQSNNLLYDVRYEFIRKYILTHKRALVYKFVKFEY